MHWAGFSSKSSPAIHLAKVRHLAEIYEKITSGRARRAREIEPTADRRLEAIAAKAMERERANRYAKATQVADEVRRWIADEPITAAPDTPSSVWRAGAGGIEPGFAPAWRACWSGSRRWLWRTRARAG